MYLRTPEWHIRYSYEKAHPSPFRKGNTHVAYVPPLRRRVRSCFLRLRQLPSLPLQSVATWQAPPRSSWLTDNFPTEKCAESLKCHNLFQCACFSAWNMYVIGQQFCAYNSLSRKGRWKFAVFAPISDNFGNLSDILLQCYSWSQLSITSRGMFRSRSWPFRPRSWPFRPRLWQNRKLEGYWLDYTSLSPNLVVANPS